MFNFLDLDLKLLQRALNWYGAYYFFKKPLPLIANLIITTHCNFDCKFCYLGPEEQKTTLPLQDYQNIIAGLGRMGTYLVYITGGEPLLLPDIAERIAYAKTKIPRVHLVTNGYLLDAKMARELGRAKIDSVAVSIDALKDKHDKFRNKEGAFDWAIEALENLARNAPRVKVFVKTQVAPWNCRDLEGLSQILRKMQVKQVFDPTTFFPALEGKSSREELVMASDAQLKLIEEFSENVRSRGGRSIKQISLKYLKNHYLSIRENDPKKYNAALFKNKCSVPYFHLQIGPDGSLSPCGALLDQLPRFSGSTPELEKTLQSKEYRQMVKGLRGCQKCLETFQYCFLTPRMCFPVGNFIKNSLAG